MPSFWIAEIRIDNTIETKIRTRRGVTGDEVRSACVPAQYERAGWHDHPQYRRRLLVEATTPGCGLRLMVILQPVDVKDGIWRLRTVLRRM